MCGISVKVGKLPGTITEIALNGDRTVRAALKAAGLKVTSDLQINVNGVDNVNKSACLRDGAIISLLKRIKGSP